VIFIIFMKKSLASCILGIERGAERVLSLFFRRLPFSLGAFWGADGQFGLESLKEGFNCPFRVLL